MAVFDIGALHEKGGVTASIPYVYRFAGLGYENDYDAQVSLELEWVNMAHFLPPAAETKEEEAKELKLEVSN